MIVRNAIEKFCILSFVTLLIFVFSGCKLSKSINDLDTIQKNKEYLKDIVIRSLELQDYYKTTQININKFESNSEIVDYILRNDNKFTSTQQYGFYLPTSAVKEMESPYENEDILIINASLPITDFVNNKYYIKVFVTSFEDGEVKIFQDYYFTFQKTNNNNNLEYLNHFISLNRYNIGPPKNLPNIENVETLYLKEKLIKIDSLVKFNSVKIKNKDAAGISGP